MDRSSSPVPPVPKTAPAGCRRALNDDAVVRVPVTVQGPQGNSLLRLKLGKVPAGAHLMRALVQTIPLDRVPPALRAPNSQFVLVVRDAHEVVAVEPAAGAARRGKDG